MDSLFRTANDMAESVVDGMRKSAETAAEPFVEAVDSLLSTIDVWRGREPNAVTTNTKNKRGAIIPQTVILPYFGETSTDVVLFAGSALIFQLHLWWKHFQHRRRRNRQQKKGPDKQEKKAAWWGREPLRPAPPPKVKSKIWKPYKDESLYAFMGKVQEQKKRLKHVEEVDRRKRMAEARKKELLPTSTSGGLGLSQRLLQEKRSNLKETGRALEV